MGEEGGWGRGKGGQDICGWVRHAFYLTSYSLSLPVFLGCCLES